MTSQLWAQFADYSKLCPDFSKGFNQNNLFAGVGYDLDGWLPALHFEYQNHKANGNSMVKMNNLF